MSKIALANTEEVEGKEKRLPISVVVPTLDRGSFLVRTIKDLLLQKPAPLEIIVVDQTSQHEPEIESAIKSWVREDKIVYIKSKKKGASHARNVAIKAAKAKILLFVDDDIRAPKNLCLSHYVNYCPPHSYDGVAGCSPLPDETLVDDLPSEYFLKHVGWVFRPMNYSQRIETCDLPTCNMSVKRNIAIAINGFDERMIRLEDTDFSYRFKEYGAKAVYDPEARLTHLLAPTGAVRDILEPINQLVLSKKERWVEYFYLVLKNFGIVYGWPILWPYFRNNIFRKVLLFNPYYLYVALSEMIQGYFMAVQRMNALPKYIDKS